MRTLTVIALAALLLFLGYRAVNPKTVELSTTNQPQLIEVIVEEVEE